MTDFAPLGTFGGPRVEFHNEDPRIFKKINEFQVSVSLLCDVPIVLALVINDDVSEVAVVVVMTKDPVPLAPITAL